jgi:protein ImuA
MARSTARRHCSPRESPRARGPVLWCVARQDLFAPALAQARLLPDRVIYAKAGDEPSVLACFEEGLRHGGLGTVIAEVQGFR